MRLGITPAGADRLRLLIRQMFRPEPINEVRGDPVNPPGSSLSCTEEKHVLTISCDSRRTICVRGINGAAEVYPICPGTVVLSKTDVQTVAGGKQ